MTMSKTITMKKGTAQISVRESRRAFYEKQGYVVVETIKSGKSSTVSKSEDIGGGLK